MLPSVPFATTHFSLLPKSINVYTTLFEDKLIILKDILILLRPTSEIISVVFFKFLSLIVMSLMNGIGGTELVSSNNLLGIIVRPLDAAT
jgi:hypothetical protein